MADIDMQFEHTATGVLGDKRETMLHNDLLQRVSKCSKNLFCGRRIGRM